MEPLQSEESEKTGSDGEQFSQPAKNVASKIKVMFRRKAKVRKAKTLLLY